VCNVTYAALIEWKDDEERKALDARLEAPLDGKTPAKSRGVRELMALMGGIGGGRVTTGGRTA